MELLQSRTLVCPADFDSALRACESFGLRSIRRYGPIGAPHGVVFATGGGGALELSRGPGAPPSGVTLWMQVPDIRAAVSELQQHRYTGTIGLPALQPWGLLECPVELFDGVRVVLVEVPHTHPLHWRE